MPTRYYGIPTNVGTAAIANAALFGVKLDIKTFVVGDGGGSYYQPTADMAALRRQTWSGNIALCEIDEEMANVINVGAYMPSDVGGFTAREIGALDSKGQLIGVANIPDAQIVKFEDGVTDETMFILSFAVTNPEVFNWYADPTVIIASKADIEKHNKIATSHPDIRDMLGSLNENFINFEDILSHKANVGLDIVYSGKLSDIAIIESNTTGVSGKFFKTSTNIVVMYGNVNITESVPTGRKVFTLPVGFRPGELHIGYAKWVSGTAGAICDLRVTTSGVASVTEVVAGSNEKMIYANFYAMFLAEQ